MARRKIAAKRVILPDPKYGSEQLAKFVNMVMCDGKKSIAEGIVYKALDEVSQKRGGDPLSVLDAALEAVRPTSRRISSRAASPTSRNTCRALRRHWPSCAA